MYAIVNIAGQQFKVTEGQQLYVHQLEAVAGQGVSFDEVLMLENNGTLTVGTPTVSGAKVSATVNAHLRGEKVVVFKKKRRKGYRVKNGHRDHFTSITINAISA